MQMLMNVPVCMVVTTIAVTQMVHINVFVILAFILEMTAIHALVITVLVHAWTCIHDHICCNLKMLQTLMNVNMVRTIVNSTVTTLTALMCVAVRMALFLAMMVTHALVSQHIHSISNFVYT